MPLKTFPDLQLQFESTPLAVRDGLDQLLNQPCLADLGEDDRGTLWTVLAEVLNNIVEHAYAACSGPIHLRVQRKDCGLQVEVTDCGAPMPNLQLPNGAPADLTDLDDLPEGGFGWFLIRAMTCDLVYDRVGEQNHLRFCMNCA